jgi:spoIIIJ-associated protein
MNEENQKLVKGLVIELFDVMRLDVRIEEERIEDIEDGKSVYTINLKTEDPSLLIGQYGANLQSFQHLIGVMTRKKLLEKGEAEDEEINFNIDVNGYKKQKKESLIKLADTIANQVLYSKNSVALRPMSSYERKIIHTEISARKNLATESMGEDIMRRIVVKYVE